MPKVRSYLSSSQGYSQHIAMYANYTQDTVNNKTIMKENFMDITIYYKQQYLKYKYNTWAKIM